MLERAGDLWRCPGTSAGAVNVQSPAVSRSFPTLRVFIVVIGPPVLNAPEMLTGDEALVAPAMRVSPAIIDVLSD